MIMEFLNLIVKNNRTDEQVDKFDKEMNELLVDLTPEENKEVYGYFYDTKDFDLLNTNRWVSLDKMLDKCKNTNRIVLNTYAKEQSWVIQHELDVKNFAKEMRESSLEHIKSSSAFQDIDKDLYETMLVHEKMCQQQVQTKNKGLCWLTMSYYSFGYQIEPVFIISIVPYDDIAKDDLKDVKEFVVKNHSDFCVVDNREHYNILMDHLGKENVTFNTKINEIEDKIYDEDEEI